MGLGSWLVLLHLWKRVAEAYLAATKLELAIIRMAVESFMADT